VSPASKIPQVRDRVCIEGHDEVFVVVHVNERSGWADLACIERVGFLTYVPLGSIRPVEEAGNCPQNKK
jgi:hypothetical protein